MPDFVNLEAGIRSLKEIAGATQQPLVGGITSAVCLVMQNIAGAETASHDYERLAQRVLDISINCAKALSEISGTGNMTLPTGQLIKALEHLASAVLQSPKQLKAIQMFNISKRMLSVKQAEKELDRAVLVFTFHLESINSRISANILTEAKLVKDEVESALDRSLKEQLALLRRKLIEKSHRKLRGSGYLPLIHPAPSIFFGRQAQTEHLVASLCSQDAAFIAILGPGGIGKTSLALTALHHPTVAEEYGQYRYFISCESCINAEGLSATIALLFDVQEKRLVPELRRLLQIADSKVIFILDNFETPWELPAFRTSVESLLCQLADIPRLSLLITLRGNERPSGVSWTRPFLPPLVTLDLLSARQTFISISDVSEREEKLDELLNIVDRVPLAITLMATQAQHTDCATLLDRWYSEKTSSVSRGYEGRLSSLDTSIQVSLNSSRLASCPLATVLLQVLSLLPDGLDVADIKNVTSPDLPVFPALTALCQVALADQDATSRFHSLSPVREYVKAHLPIDDAHLIPVLDFHRQLASYAEASQYTAERASMIMTLTRQIGNIHSVLLYSMERESLVNQSIQAIVDVSSFHFATFQGAIPRLLELAYLKAKSAGLRRLEASCLVARAKVLGFSNQHEQLDMALSIFREIGDCEGAASTLLASARAYDFQAAWEKGAEKLQEAFSFLSQDSPQELRAQAFRNLSLNLLERRLIPDAVQAAKDGLNSLDVCRYHILASNISYSWAMCCLSRGLITPALDLSQQALGYLVEGDRNRGPLSFTIGTCFLLQSRLEEAKIAAEHACAVFVNSGRVRDMASCHELLGHIHMYRSEFDYAMRYFHLALEVFVSSGLKYRIASSVASLGELELFQGNLNTSMAYYNHAQKLVRELNLVGKLHEMLVLCGKGDLHFISGNISGSLSIAVIMALIASRNSSMVGTAMAAQRIGDIFAKEGDFTTAKSCYGATWDWIQYLGVRRHMADCLLRLGIISLLEGKDPDSRVQLERAERCFLAAQYPVGAQYCRARLVELDIGMRPLEFPFLPLATVLMTP